MRTLTFKLLLFALPILCLLAYVERALRPYPNSYSVKRDYLNRALLDTEVLITGSSHSFYGIRPRLLNAHAFSLAYVSQDLYQDTRLVLKYLGRMPKLKTVVIPVSYFTLESRLDTTAESWREPFYSHVYGIQDRRPLDLANHSLLALYGPDRARQLLLEGPPPPDIGEDGGIASGGLPPGRPETLADRATLIRHESGMHPEYAVGNLRSLENLLNALRDRGISAVFVTTPVYTTYSAALNREAYRRMQTTLSDLCKRYGLEYWNHMEDAQFTSADFSDSDHLDRGGAVKFTEILRKEVFRRESGYVLAEAHQ